MLLEVEGLHVRYGAVRALAGVSLVVAPNETVTVLGANGAGKTTLLKAILGTVPALRGIVIYDGVEITKLSPGDRVRKGIVLVPEGRRILVNLTVHENLLLGAHHIRDDGQVRRTISELYDRFPNLARRRALDAGCLSGGEQQMLAVARALLARPRLLMLDEPSLGLSPLFVDRLFQWLGELRDGGLTILLVEQNTVQALALSNRGYVLNLGQVATSGPAGALAADPLLQAAYLGGAEAGRIGMAR